MGYVDFSVTPLSSLVHRWDAHILFTAEPDSGLSSLADGVFINWTATYGALSSPTGWVSVFSPAFEDDDYASGSVADVIAYSGSSEVPETYISSTGQVFICHGHIDLSLNATPNFSPHLSETNTIVIAAAMHNCTHDATPGEGCTFEIELMRENTSGWQHVAWLDADPGTAGSQDAFTITNGWQGTTLQWDGIATESAAQATSPDVFTQGTQPFNRIFPTVTSGKPLPPPFYTLFTRIRKNDTIYAHASQTVYIPQVVKIQWDAAAVSLFKQDLYTDGTEPHIRIYHTTNTAADAAIASLPGLVQGLFPSDMNIRVTTNSVIGDCKNVSIVLGENIITNRVSIAPPRGRLISADDYIQTASPNSECLVYLRGEFIELKSSFTTWYSTLETDLDITSFESFNETALTWMIAKTSTHEVGHSLGLVATVLGGVRNHDPKPYNHKSIMVSGGDSTLADVLGDAEWLITQSDYLKFILPK